MSEEYPCDRGEGMHCWHFTPDVGGWCASCLDFERARQDWLDWHGAWTTVAAEDRADAGPDGWDFAALTSEAAVPN